MSNDDNQIRLFEVPLDGVATHSDWASSPSLRPALWIKEGETIYDMEWYPGMNSGEPSTCCFLSTSRDNPVHVWDAFTGHLRAAYCAYTDAEELDAAYSICFDRLTPSNKLYCGFNNCIRIYDVERPGRQHAVLKTFKRAHGQSTGQRGIVSCAAINPDKSGLLAAGTYSRNIGLYDTLSGKLLYNLQGHRGGVTQVNWGPEGCYLYSGARKDDEILCWDVRGSGDALFRLPRAVRTNQRVQFSVDQSGSRLITPSQEDGTSGASDCDCEGGGSGVEGGRAGGVHSGARGQLRIFDLCTGSFLTSASLPTGALCGVQLHPFHQVIAAIAGQRNFDLPAGPAGPAEEDPSAPLGLANPQEAGWADPEAHQDPALFLASL